MKFANVFGAPMEGDGFHIDNFASIEEFDLEEDYTLDPEVDYPPVPEAEQAAPDTPENPEEKDNDSSAKP